MDISNIVLLKRAREEQAKTLGLLSHCFLFGFSEITDFVRLIANAILEESQDNFKRIIHDVNVIMMSHING